VGLPSAVPGSGSGLVGSYENKVFNFTTTVPYFQLNLYLPSQNFTAVLTYLDGPNFSILCALHLNFPDPPLLWYSGILWGQQHCSWPDEGGARLHRV